VNCQGVIHHTPNTEQCVKEISRVLKVGGTANISVYYKNFFLRKWRYISFFSKFFKKSGAKMEGRGRENIYGLNDIDEIVRHYDGAENPIGKAYSKQEFIDMCGPYFDIENARVFFFPARTLPFKIPLFLHQFLDKNFGFMINLKLRKKACAE
ncbi:MAG: methyltransferase domain-containing protein, partial [Campylobacterales bacterium]